jgi:SAM-dependent methyltransferase
MSTDPQWYRDDDFWEALAPVFFTPERVEKAAEQVDLLVPLLGLSPGGAVLDLCCGPGRHALEFARRGYSVTGVDRTATYLEDAAKRAADEGLQVEFIEADMCDFVREGAFDAAINMFTSFGYTENPDDDLKILRKVYKSLKPNGRFLIDLAGKEIIARIFAPQTWVEVADGTIVVEERWAVDNWTAVDNRWIVIKGDQRRDFRFKHRAFSARELSDMLREVGFSVRDVMGTLDGAPYDHAAKRLVVLAGK